MKRLKEVRVEMAVGLSLVSLMILGTAERSKGFAPTPPTPSNPKEPSAIAVQIQEDVDQALRVNRDARTAFEWQTSGYAPSDIFRNIHDLKIPDAWQILCGRFSSLAPQDLLLFEEDGLKPENFNNLPASCQRLFQKPAPPVAAKPQKSRPKNRLTRLEQIELTFEGDTPFLHLPKLLDVLSEQGILATFFISEEGAKNHMDAVRAIRMAGHSIGLLGESPRLPHLNLVEAKEKLRSARSWLSMAVGNQQPSSLLIPVRFQNSEGLAASELNDPIQGQFLDFVQKEGLTPAGWDIDAEDWRYRNPDRLYQHLLAQLKTKKRGVIRFQSISGPVVKALPRFLAALKEKKSMTLASDSASTPLRLHRD